MGWNALIGWSLGIIDGYILFKDWNTIYIIKRKRIHLAAIWAIFCFFVFLYVPLLSLYFGNFLPSLHEDVAFHIYGWIGLPCVFGFVWLFLSKMWLFYYDSQIISFENNKNWRMAIDPINESKNWFVINSKTFGNSKYLLKFILLITIIQVVLFRLPSEVFGLSLVSITIFSIFSIIWIILAVFLIKQLNITEFYFSSSGASVKKGDPLGIRQELISVVMVGIIATIIIIVMAVISVLIDLDVEIFMFVVIFLFATAFHVFLFLIILYPKYLNTQRLDKHKTNNKNKKNDTTMARKNNKSLKNSKNDNCNNKETDDLTKTTTDSNNIFPKFKIPIPLLTRNSGSGSRSTQSKVESTTTTSTHGTSNLTVRSPESNASGAHTARPSINDSLNLALPAINEDSKGSIEIIDDINGEGHKSANWSLSDASVISLKLPLTPTTPIATRKNATSNRQRNRSSWKTTIATYHGFEAFMRHLEKEFSMECLLFLQEV